MNKPPRSKAQLQQWREMQEADDPTLENFSGWNEEKEQQKIDDLTHNTMIAAAGLQTLTDNSEEKADIDKSLPEEPPDPLDASVVVTVHAARRAAIASEGRKKAFMLACGAGCMPVRYSSPTGAFLGACRVR